MHERKSGHLSSTCRDTSGILCPTRRRAGGASLRGRRLGYTGETRDCTDGRTARSSALQLLRDVPSPNHEVAKRL